MRIKTTVLCENTVFSNLMAVAEHGWSVFLETDKGNFLFDTGLGFALLNNARAFGKDLAGIKGIIISHHHIDHTGGLLDALSVTGPVDIFSHPMLFKESYNIKNGERFIGVPFTRTALESKGARFIFNAGFTEIVPDLYVTGEIPRITDFETGEKSVVLKTAEGYVQDQLLDDQSVVIKTEKGLFIVLGCSHAGLINTISYAVTRTGIDRIHAVIGGTHLWTVTDEQLDKTIQALKGLGIEKLGVSHCTGFKVSMRLAQEFPDSFFVCNTGSVLEV